MIFRRVSKGRFLFAGDGATTYHPLYIDNLVDAFIAAAETESACGQSYLIADEEYVPIRELVGRTAASLGMPCQKSFVPFWPAEQLFHARVITGFHRRGPSEVEITAHAAPIALGSLFEEPVDALMPLASRITEGGLPAETNLEMRAVLWAKMLYNCALNPLGALAGRRYGELTADPTTRRLVDEVIREIFVVLSAAQIEVAWPAAEQYLATFHDELIPATAGHESSMLQDLRAGRPTEIEALCGAVERLGYEHGVQTPVISALARLVRAAERTAQLDS